MRNQRVARRCVPVEEKIREASEAIAGRRMKVWGKWNRNLIGHGNFTCHSRI